MAINEFYSTRSKFFFQDKISVERVESSKMSTLVSTENSWLLFTFDIFDSFLAGMGRN